MRMPRYLLVTSGLVALHFTPSAAQGDQRSELRTLRDRIDQTAATLAELRKQLEGLEAAQEGASASLPSAALPAPTPDAATLMTVDTGAEVDRCAFLDTPPTPADAPLSAASDTASATCRRSVAAVLLRASSASSGVTVRLSRGTEGGDPKPERGETRAYSNVYSLTASAPLAKEGPTQIGTLDGFASSSKLSFGFTRFMIPLPTAAGLPPRYVQLVSKAQAVCRKQVEAETIAGRPASFPGSCEEDTPRLHRAFLADDEVRELERLLAHQTVRRALSYGLELSIGHENFTFRDSATLAENEVSRVPLGAKASLSIFPWPRSSLTGAIDYQRTFKASKTRIFCPTGITGGTTECFSSPFAAPVKTEKVLLSSELRQVFDWGEESFIPQLGIAPRVEFDANNDDFAVSLPVYLAADDKGKLLAGIQAGYSIAETDASKPGKERDFKVGLFVGSALTLP